MTDWKSQDTVALRGALGKIKSHRLKEELMSRCSATITPDDALKGTSEGIARLGSYRAGYEKCIDTILEIVNAEETASVTPGYSDMS